MTGPAGGSRRTAAALAAALVLLTAGCGASPGRSEEQSGGEMDRRAELAARPSLEEAVARYEGMQTRIRERLDAELGPFAWAVQGPEGEAGCGFDFPDTGGETRTLAWWGFEDDVSDADWPRAREIVRAIAADYGFDVPGMAIDRPGDHRFTAVDPRLGASIDFATQRYTSLAVSTGCHLPAAKR